MFLHNQIEDLPNFHDAIGDQLEKAHKVAFAVSYVQRSGVAALKKHMAAIGGNIRLVCSFDMDITDPLAIKQLMDMGATVKIYHAQRGTLHAKLWLFKSVEGYWNCIVGSANLSAHALHDNVEAGVLIAGKDNREAVGEALKIFDFLWNGDNCRELTNADIETWIQERDKREKIKLRSPRPLSPDEDPDRKMLRLTEHGKRFSLAATINEKKKNYTEAMREYLYNGLPLLQFTYGLLKRMRSVSFTEFSFFASHAYSLDELDSIASLIDIYRNLPPESRKRFEMDVDAYFHEKLEHTAINVRGNYDKKVKHTMSALGWCARLQFDSAKKELRLAE